LALASGGVSIVLLGVAFIVSRHVPINQLYCTRAVVLILAAELVLVVILRRDAVIRRVSDFFSGVSAPVNLAIFRIVVFWRIFREVELASILPYTHMPAGLLVPPSGMGSLVRFFPLSERFVTACTAILLTFSILGIFGVYSRFSALVCAVLCFYLLGIPQLCGKVDYYHHLVWFATLLVLSPCGDCLALDAIIAARKRADAGITTAPSPSNLYGLPLRVAMIVLGLIYFFPGIWKLWESGLNWFRAGNLASVLHQFWTWSYDMTWLPKFRIDRHPLLLEFGAVATVLFEISFIFLVFFPKLRVVAAFGGVLFHNLTNQIMRISFFSLQESYVALLDWDGIFRWVGGRLYGSEMFFVYKRNCSACARTVASLRVVDIFERVIYIEGGKHPSMTEGLPDVRGSSSTGDPFSHVEAIVGERRWTGLEAYRVLFYRIPIFWPFLPLLCFPGAAVVASGLSGHVGKARQRPIAFGPKPRSASGRQVVGIAAFAIVLVCAIVVCGFGKVVSGWPVACYPTFSAPPQREIPSVRAFATMPDGKSVQVRFNGITYHRLYWMLLRAVPSEGGIVDQGRLNALWKLAVRNDPQLGLATTVAFYKEVLWTSPDLWQSNPKDRKTLYTIVNQSLP